MAAMRKSTMPCSMMLTKMYICRLCTESVATFDPKMNDTHTQECLKRLLCLYQDEDTCHCRMGAYVALYMLFNLGSTEATFWGLQLKPHIGWVLWLSINLGDALKCFNMLWFWGYVMSYVNLRLSQFAQLSTFRYLPATGYWAGH